MNILHKQNLKTNRHIKSWKESLCALSLPVTNVAIEQLTWGNIGACIIWYGSKYTGKSKKKVRITDVISLTIALSVWYTEKTKHVSHLEKPLM